MKWICTLSLVKDHALLCAVEYRGSYQSLWSSRGPNRTTLRSVSGYLVEAQCAF